MSWTQHRPGATLGSLLLLQLLPSLIALEEFNLGIYGSFVVDDLQLIATAVAFDLDFKKNWDPAVRAQYGDPIVNIPNLSPDLRIKSQLCDSGGTVQVGMRCALNMFQGQNGFDKISSLVGGYYSSISMPVTSVANIFEVPQVSWGSTSPKLSNKATYPFFMRTIPPDSIQGGGMWQFIEHFLVPTVVFVYSQEAYGEGLFQAVVDNAAANEESFRLSGVGIRSMPTGTYDNDEALGRLLLVKRLGTKIILLGMNTDQARNMLPLAESEGMLSEQYQWIGSEAVSVRANPDVIPVGWMNFAPISKGPLFATHFENLWTQLTVDAVIGEAAQSTYKIDLFETVLSESPSQLSADTFEDTGSLPLEAPFIFDAAYSIVIAVNELLNEGIAMADIKGPLLRDKIMTVSFEGITGVNAFNENGDRMASYDIMNIQPGKIEVPAALYSAVTGLITSKVQDLWWMTNTASWTIPDSLVSCAPGFWKDADATRACYECEPGTISDGGTVTMCDPCPAGSMANAARGATQCTECQAGNFSAESKSTMCHECPAGLFNSAAGETKCELCPVGEYAESKGATSCSRCAEGKRRPELYATQQKVAVAGVEEWVPFAGATNASSCGCKAGAYQQDGECDDCGEGMTCPGFGEVLIESGYFAAADAPGFVYRCIAGDSGRCPGGLPGACAEGRDLGSLACTFCEEGKRNGDEGVCVECGDVDALPLTAAIILGALLLLVVYRIIDTSNPASQTKSILLVAIAGSQMVTMFQQLSVFGSISLEWGSPFDEMLQFISLFNFKLDYLSLDCVARVKPLSKFGFRVFMVLIFFAFMGVVHCASVVILYKCDFRARMPALIGAVGTIFSAFFISIVASMLAPFQCNLHPNGLKTVHDYPSVVCWDDQGYGDGGHGEMVTIAVVANLIPLAFLAATCYVVKKLPEKLASGDTEFLNAFRFLFFRFRPGSSWFIIVFLLRNLFIALVPAFGDTTLQILLLEVIMLPLLVLVVYTRPWGVFAANVLDVSNAMFLCTLLHVFALFTEDVDAKMLAKLCVAIVCSALLMVLGAISFGLYERFVRSGKPFQFFICHHKAGAGNLARLLKMSLLAMPKVKRDVFVDSDNLKDLGALFGVVASDTETLCVLCSQQIMLRPWCMGEVTTAQVNKVQVVTVILPGFEWPEEAFFDKYEEHCPDSKMLSSYGIGLDLLKTAMRWLETNSRITARGMFSGDTLKQLVDNLLLAPPKKGQEPRRFTIEDVDDDIISHKKTVGMHPDKSTIVFKNCILANMRNMESFSSAIVLQRLLTRFFQGAPSEIPQVIGISDTELPLGVRQMCLVCDETTFSATQVIVMVMQAAEANMAILPVVSSAMFRFPTASFLRDLSSSSHEVLQSAELPYSGMMFSKVVARIFKEIAIEVNPQDAEGALEVRAAAVYSRLVKGLRTLGIDVNETITYFNSFEADDDDDESIAACSDESDFETQCREMMTLPRHISADMINAAYGPRIGGKRQRRTSRVSLHRRSASRESASRPQPPVVPPRPSFVGLS